MRSRFRTALRLVTEHPYSGQRTDHPGMRRIVLTPYPYLIFYSVMETDLVVVRVGHAARDPGTMPDAP